jgi:hypothetical protein
VAVALGWGGVPALRSDFYGRDIHDKIYDFDSNLHHRDRADDHSGFVNNGKLPGLLPGVPRIQFCERRGVRSYRSTPAGGCIDLL